MTTTPPDSNRPMDIGSEPADLSELTATDALLDRLGARLAADTDLGDPAVQALAELLAEIDETRVPDVGAARLIEVLAGRPLYIAGGEPATEAWLPDVIANGTHVIDLTDQPDDVTADHVETGDVETDDVEPDDLTAGSPTVPIARPESPEVVPIGSAASARARRWDGAFGHVALPAACVLLLLAIGGGVSAAVTGDPMTPVNGISRVVAQLPGVKDDKVDQVQGEIKAARQAVITKNNEAAALHLDRARTGLDSVSGADKSDLTKQISEVAGLVPTASTEPTAPGPGSVVATTDPSVEATPTPEPSAPDAAEPTAEPTADPDPTTDPVTPDDNETTAPDVAEETPAAEATGS